LVALKDLVAEEILLKAKLRWDFV